MQTTYLNDLNIQSFWNDILCVKDEWDAPSLSIHHANATVYETKKEAHD